jgi:hypothetical protein
MDRTTKALLAIVAAGLWTNVAIPLFHPTLHLSSIANGTCTNRKIC